MRKIGKGARSVVYLADWTSPEAVERSVAVKEIAIAGMQTEVNFGGSPRWNISRVLVKEQIFSNISGHFPLVIA